MNREDNAWTVKQLIEALQQIENQDTIVLTLGYEGGYEAVFELSNNKVKFDGNVPWYYGPYEGCGDEGKAAIIL
jgi:hypothetical protein